MLHATEHTMETTSQTIRLAARALHSVDDVAGLQLRCQEGTLWLTLDHDTRDVILEAGDTYVGTEHRRGLVYALGDARFSVSPAVAPAPTKPRGWAVAHHA
jgi:hypothetical protein